MSAAGQLGQIAGFARAGALLVGDLTADERFSVLHLFDFADDGTTPEPEPTVTITPASGGSRRSRSRGEFPVPRPHEMRHDRPDLGLERRTVRKVVVEVPLDASAAEVRQLLAQAELEEREILELEELGLLDW